MKKILLGVLGTLILAGWINLSNGLAQNLTISGYIRTSDGSGIQGVVMNGLPGTPTPSTDDGGYYSAEIGYSWSGTVKPTKIGYAIHPPSKNYTNVTSSITDDYRGTILPKVALRLNRESYYGNEPIEVTLTIENQGIDIITTQGFASKDSTSALRFTDPDEKPITANLPPGAVLPTPLAPPTVATPTGESIPADYVEIVPQGWVWSNTFNAFDSYTLTKPGNYSVKAKFSMSDYLEYDETAPGSGIFYSPLDSGSLRPPAPLGLRTSDLRQSPLHPPSPVAPYAHVQRLCIPCTCRVSGRFLLCREGVLSPVGLPRKNGHRD